MSDFLTVEEAARQLGLAESELRNWIRTGQARASRRGGDYLLRPSEVQRLGEGGPRHPSEEVSRPRALPPRSKDNPESFSGERDRRRRMGRRSTDFTLEILHQEIQSAVGLALGTALGPLMTRLDSLNSEMAPVPGVEAQPQEVERIREEFRQRLQESEEQRLQLEKSCLEKSFETQQLHAQLEQLQQQLRQPRGDEGELDFLRQEVRQLREELAKEPVVDPENARLRNSLSEQDDLLEQLRSQVSELQSMHLTVEAERARWALETRSMECEIERLSEIQQRQDKDLRHHQEEVQRLRASAQAHEDKDVELKRLREQVNSLTYRLQMAGSGSHGPSPEDARKALEKLAQAEAEMRKKDQLIDQGYFEISELRSKLEDAQRAHYDLQQRYERLKEEWSQLAARQMNEYQQQHQANQPGPTPERKQGWGGLFRMRGDQ